ncbi:unnamed protein product, partial [Staurois parvus]
WALTGGTDWQHCWAALVGGTGGQHWWVGTGGWAQGGWHWWAQVGGHRWVALLGTGRWHFWTQVCDTAEWTLVGAAGTGGCTAGHRWVICWAQVGGASGRTAGHRWAELAGGTAGHRSSGH